MHIFCTSSHHRTVWLFHRTSQFPQHFPQQVQRIGCQEADGENAAAFCAASLAPLGIGWKRMAETPPPFALQIYGFAISGQKMCCGEAQTPWLVLEVNTQQRCHGTPENLGTSHRRMFNLKHFELQRTLKSRFLLSFFVDLSL